MKWPSALAGESGHQIERSTNGEDIKSLGIGVCGRIGGRGRQTTAALNGGVRCRITSFGSGIDLKRGGREHCIVAAEIVRIFKTPVIRPLSAAYHRLNRPCLASRLSSKPP